MRLLIRLRRLVHLVIAFAALAGAASAQTPPLPPELVAAAPISLLPADPLPHLDFSDRSGGATPATVVLAEVPGYGQVLRGNNPNRNQKHYAAEFSWPTATPLKKGDVCLLRFSARALAAKQETGEGALNFHLQEPKPPFRRFASEEFGPGPDWSLFEFPFVADRDYAPGEAMLGFTFAHLVQSFEIADVALLNFQNRIPLARLPKTRFSYAGRGEQAAWRAAALARIEKIRTAPLAIRVTDAAGRALPGARVQAELVQPEFIFASSVNSGLIAQATPEAECYRQAILELFDSVTIENGLKWRGWIGESAKREETRRALDWVLQNNLRLRGHALSWPGMSFTPRVIKERTDLDQMLDRLVTDHIREIMPVTRGRVYGWDVINELIHERDYLKHVTEQNMADWFKLARELDPHAQLFINDYNMLTSARSPAVIARYREIIGQLRRAGAPIDGVGIQAHIGQQVRDPLKVLADLDLMAAEGLPIHITEFDIETADEELQADYTRDFLIACYSHPAVTGFTMWGFWEGAHWKRSAAMYRRDWTPKPNLAPWRELVLQKWRTRIDMPADSAGTVATRGHLGRYRVTVTVDGIVHQQTLTLGSRGAEVVVTFPQP